MYFKTKNVASQDASQGLLEPLSRIVCTETVSIELLGSLAGQYEQAKMLEADQSKNLYLLLSSYNPNLFFCLTPELSLRAGWISERGRYFPDW